MDVCRSCTWGCSWLLPDVASAAAWTFTVSTAADSAEVPFCTTLTFFRSVIDFSSACACWHTDNVVVVVPEELLLDDPHAATSIATVAKPNSTLEGSLVSMRRSWETRCNSASLHRE